VVGTTLIEHIVDDQLHTEHLANVVTGGGVEQPPSMYRKKVLSVVQIHIVVVHGAYEYSLHIPG
jgi:hypothetical protein